MLFVPTTGPSYLTTQTSHILLLSSSGCLSLLLYSATHSLPKIHESPYSVFGFTSKSRTSVRVWIWLGYLLVRWAISTHTYSTQTLLLWDMMALPLGSFIGFLSSTGNGCSWLLTRIHIVYIRSRRILMNSACVHVHIRPEQSHIWNDLSNPCSSTCMDLA